MMQDRSISLGCFAAYGLWTAALALMIGGTLLTEYTPQNWGLVCSAAAATATIRQYFVRQNRMLRNVLSPGHVSETIPIRRER